MLPNIAGVQASINKAAPLATYICCTGHYFNPKVVACLKHKMCMVVCKVAAPFLNELVFLN